MTPTQFLLTNVAVVIVAELAGTGLGLVLGVLMHGLRVLRRDDTPEPWR